jgi:hypothetical protein
MMETSPSSDDATSMIWWNLLDERERLYWLNRAGSARPVDAWRAFKKSIKYPLH